MRTLLLALRAALAAGPPSLGEVHAYEERGVRFDDGRIVWGQTLDGATEVVRHVTVHYGPAHEPDELPDRQPDWLDP